jgi:malonyl-CoA decarboxylase
MEAALFERLRKARQRARENSAVRALRDTSLTLLSERGEANSVKFAAALIDQYRALGGEARSEFFDILAEEFAPDPTQVLERARRYAEAASAETPLPLLEVAEPPRQELMRRINLAPEGTVTLLAMRSELLRELKRKPELAAVDADLRHLLASWFNPGFLNLVRVDWGSPARLLEQIIRHEAVHEIRDWADLRRRLEPDRRCFAFLHPALPEDLLIFVEVALTDAMPDSVEPLLADGPSGVQPERARCAVFYSISNCQTGLRGVSLGNFLIKRVCEKLKSEFPRLTQFCTLSPMPGFAAWLRRGARLDAAELRRRAGVRLEDARAALQAAFGELREPPALAALQGADKPQREALLRLGVGYLMRAGERDAGTDPVARFHLNNGARIERLNYLANASPRGLRESWGLMVNYVYDLGRIERYHESFVNGHVEAAREVLHQL